MGYACPVCDVPQRDERHLADHLAFTAMLRHEAHEAWLDEHVSDWGERSPVDLGPELADLADEAEFEAVFEDTVHGRDHDHGRGRPDVDVGTRGYGGAGGRGAGDSDAETRSVMREARELTREMYGTRENETESDATDDADDGGTDDE